MKSNISGRVRSIFVHLVLIFLSFLCLFFFYILIVNATGIFFYFGVNEIQCLSC